MINVVMPLGKGFNFTEQGYCVNKPFLPIDDLPMFLQAINNLNLQSVNYIFVCSEEFEAEVMSELKKQTLFSISCATVIKTDETQGSACSVLSAKSYINNDDELLILFPDLLIGDYNFGMESLTFYRKEKADGGIICFICDQSNYPYIGLQGGKIYKVVEKEIISNLGCAGLYYFRKGKDFVDAAADMILKDEKINNEYYIAPSYNYLITQGKKVIPYMVNYFVGLATPEDYEKFIFSK